MTRWWGRGRRHLYRCSSRRTCCLWPAEWENILCILPQSFHLFTSFTDRNAKKCEEGNAFEQESELRQTYKDYIRLQMITVCYKRSLLCHVLPCLASVRSFTKTPRNVMNSGQVPCAARVQPSRNLQHQAGQQRKGPSETRKSWAKVAHEHSNKIKTKLTTWDSMHWRLMCHHSQS